MRESQVTLENQPQLERKIGTHGYELIVGIERGMIFWGEVRKDEHRDMEHFHGVDDPCPWVVLSSDHIHRRMPIAIAAPITTKLEGKEAGNLRMHRIRIPVEQQGRYRLISGEAPLRQVDSLVLTEQVRACAHSRFLGNPVARLDETMMHAIEAGAKFALDFA